MNKLRFSFAVIFAFVAFAFTNRAEQPAASSVQALFEFVEDHPLEGQTLTEQQIEDQNLCPGTGQICAREVGNPSNVIEWQGNPSKF